MTVASSTHGVLRGCHAVGFASESRDDGKFIIVLLYENESHYQVNYHCLDHMFHMPTIGLLL